MKLTFLTAAMPLTKTIIKQPDGSIDKDPYPTAKLFTSNTEEVKDLYHFYELVKAAAQHPAKPCLLKGELQQELVNESRKGMTRTNDTTLWVCKDLDDAEYNTPDEYMKAAGLDDISYVVQYSSSHKLDKKKKSLSCHIFFMLSAPVPANELKAWFMHLNLTIESLKNSLSLSSSMAFLHWPLDITCSQNDKLIFIAEPTFVNMKSPVKIDERIQLVKREHDVLPVERIALRPIEILKKEQRRVLNDLQTAAGIPATKRKSVMIDGLEVQKGVPQATQWKVYDAGEFWRLDINGGDSRAYYHPKNNPKILHSFKGDERMLMSEILPDYYAERVQEMNNLRATPNENGDIILAFREKVTADYWKGTWNPEKKILDINKVKNREQILDYLRSHNLPVGEFVPEWHMIFDPKNPNIVNEEDHVINMFAPSHYMHEENQVEGKFPAIQKFIDSAVGTGEIQDHFLNWLAYIFQTRQKALTAWVLHGTYGTGKGMLIDRIITPLLGDRYVYPIRASELNENFNAYMERSLIVFVDEIDVDMFTSGKTVFSNLFNWITDRMMTVRRMRTDSYKVPNHCHFIFASNKKQPVHIPVGDRRFNVGHFQHSRLTTSAEELDSLDHEIKHFAYFMQNYEVDMRAVHMICHTEERAEIQRLGVTSIDQLATDLLTGNLGGLLDALPDMKLIDQMGIINPTAAAYVELVKRFSKEQVSRISRDELAVLFTHCVGKVPEGSHKFGAFLRHHGIITKVLRRGDDTPRGIEVEWKLTDDDRLTIHSLFKDQPKRLKAVK